MNDKKTIFVTRRIVVRLSILVNSRNYIGLHHYNCLQRTILKRFL